jgi:hypothetical protein
MFVQSPNFSALLQGPDHRFVLTNAAYEHRASQSDRLDRPRSGSRGWTPGLY